MEKTVITFNGLPEVVAQLRDEVMSLKSLLTEQRSVNNAKAVDTHVPMYVDEAADYLGIPKGTLYMKLSDGSIPATKPGNVTGKSHGRGQELYQHDTWRPDKGSPDAERYAGKYRCDEHKDRQPDHT